ncbi:MAG: hypothetical protein ABFR97_04705 [Thermodesulfobacteriota bacterium]
MKFSYLFILVLLSLPNLCQGAAPPLTLLYTNDGRGETEPCG